MKKLFIFLFTALTMSVSAQTDSAAQTIKKNQLGLNIGPAFTVLLNGDNHEPEFKLLYKRHLAKNHFARGSYSFTGLSNQYLLGHPDHRPRRVNHTYSEGMVNDSTFGTFSTTSRNQNHVFKFGYEYQFKLGKRKRVALNLGGDVLIGYGNTKYRNSTNLYRSDNLYEDWIRNETRTFNSRRMYFGGSPFAGLHVDLGKGFYLAFEMAFDLYKQRGLKDNPQATTSYMKVNYRPTLIFGYTF